MANILTSDPLLSYILHYQPSKEWLTSLGSCETSSEGHIFLLNSTGASNVRVYQWEMLQCVFLFPLFLALTLSQLPNITSTKLLTHVTFHLSHHSQSDLHPSTQDEGAAFVSEVSILQGEITHSLDTDGPGVQFRIAASSQSDLGH